MAVHAILHEDDLEKRVKTIKGGARDLGMMRAKMSKLLDQIYGTIPVDELVSIKHNAQALRCDVGVRNVADKGLQTYGRWLSFEELDTIIRCCDDMCLMCDHSEKTVRKCALRKVLERIGGVQPSCGVNV